MNRSNATAPDFPMESFLQVKQDIISSRLELEKDTAAWSAARKKLSKAEANALDEQFKAAFETLASLSGLEEIFRSLQELVRSGASATLLGNDELGTYNLAMFIQDIHKITSPAGLDTASRITRLTITAGADLRAQKAYAGNGGSTCLEWLCIYLALGTGHPTYPCNRDQYACYYTVFPWVIDHKVVPPGFHPFRTFIACLDNAPDVADLQEKVILRMMALGFSPLSPEEHELPPSFFSRVAAVNEKWLTTLFPFEDDRLKPYLDGLRADINEAAATCLVNGFTSNNKARKHFKAFFSPRPHWLLEWMIAVMPASIFSLVKRNEQDLLAPFLKNFKPAIAALRDANGNTLLHQAVLSRGTVKNTIQLLCNANLPSSALNNEGLTPLALAMKNNRADLAELL